MTKSNYKRVCKDQYHIICLGIFGILGAGFSLVCNGYQVDEIVILMSILGASQIGLVFPIYRAFIYGYRNKDKIDSDIHLNLNFTESGPTGGLRVAPFVLVMSIVVIFSGCPP